MDRTQIEIRHECDPDRRRFEGALCVAELVYADPASANQNVSDMAFVAV
jgi:hypothetical protein